MIIFGEETRTFPSSVHEMVAGGRLPEWIQKKRTEDPSSTVWLSGSERNVARITAGRKT